MSTPLAASPGCRVELAGPLVLVHVGPLSLRLERARCEEITTTLAVAMVRLARRPRTHLELVEPPEGPCESP